MRILFSLLSPYKSIRYINLISLFLILFALFNLSSNSISLFILIDNAIHMPGCAIVLKAAQGTNMEKFLTVISS